MLLLDRATHGELPAYLIVLAIGAAAAGFALSRARHIAQERLALMCRSRAAQRLARHLSVARYEDLAAVPMADLREILLTDASSAAYFLAQSVAHLSALGFWLIASVILTAWSSLLLLGVLALVGVVFAVWVGYGLRAHLALTGERFRRQADVSQRAREIVEVERVVVARQFGLGMRFVDTFLDAHDRFTDVVLRQGKLNAVVRSALLGLNGLAFLTIVCAGGVLITQSGLSAGALVAVLFVVGQLLGTVAQLGDLAGRGAEAGASGRRLMAYWAAEPDQAEPAALDGRLRRINVVDASFAYGSGPSVLNGLSLSARRGQITAVTAATGTGKTTLALLLAGMLRPTGGAITFDGRSDLTPERLPPGRILYVGPKPVLFEGTIRDNLFLSANDSVDPALLALFEPLSRTGLLPPERERWLDTPLVGPNGTGVSSGQGQLIQIARAAVRDPDLILFDEASGALDMPTEAAVQTALTEWCRQRICLVVSHRPCPWLDDADAHILL